MVQYFNILSSRERDVRECFLLINEECIVNLFICNILCKITFFIGMLNLLLSKRNIYMDESKQKKKKEKIDKV